MVFKRIRSFGVFFAMLFLAISVSAQEKVWVFLKDKKVDSYDPYTYLDQKAIDRRLKHGLDLHAYTDVPVNQDYINSVSNITGNVKVSSRWFNAICCFATEDQIQLLKKQPFVTSVKVVNVPQKFCAGYGEPGSSDEDFVPTEDQIAYLKAQTERMQAAVFVKNKVDGKGVRVAIFDVGFKSYKTNPAFEHIRAENRIIKTYNFVKNKEDVENGGTHGTFVMSCVGGRIAGQNMGLATGAEFLLARTETWTEFYSEEENWLAAAEWADKNGADVINSSLGYTIHRYFKEDMDGQKSLVARAANMAASKGIIVVNSAGNEGADRWKRIGTPADADSVLSVGGLDPYTGLHTSFSSFGPTQDKRLKPNVTAYGHVIGSGPDGVSKTQGTSFSGPLVAGFVACAVQLRPGYKNMQLFHDIEKSADLYPYFDYAHGYGVPQASYFFKIPSAPTPSFELKEFNKAVWIYIDTTLNNTGLNLNNKTIEDRYIVWPDYVFYHFENQKGYLDKYFVVDPGKDIKKYTNQEISTIASGTTSTDPLVIPKSVCTKPCTLRVFYKGYVQEIKIK